MPSKHRIKEYHENGYYHIFNRGVEKRNIFENDQDKSVFLSYLRDYLMPKDLNKLQSIISNYDSDPHEKDRALKLMRLNNFFGQIELIAYCLMPNHFHLLIKQYASRSIEIFMKSFSTRYVQYFNHRHEHRVGALFQDIYKAVLIDSEEQLLYVTRYIHRNSYQKGWSLKDRPGTSSYLNYLGQIKQDWVKPGEVLRYFTKTSDNSYENFTEDSKYDEMTVEYVERKGSTF